MTFPEYYAYAATFFPDYATDATAPAPPQPAARPKRVVKHKRRYCKTTGCTRIVKSQGLCQRHGAVAKKCMITGCTKQAQGNFSGMCSKYNYVEYSLFVFFLESSHDLTFCFSVCFLVSTPPELHYNITQSGVPSFANKNVATLPAAPPPPLPRPQPGAVGGVDSVYDTVLPMSVGFIKPANDDDGSSSIMPLVRHFLEGAGKPPAWHRTEERMARGLPPVEASTALEDWERVLLWMEILLLSGSSIEAFSRFAAAWGQEEGFQLVLSQVLGGGTSAAAPVAATQPQPAAAAAGAVLSNAQGVASSTSRHSRAPTTDIGWGQQDDDQITAQILDGSFLFETTTEAGNVTESHSSSDQEFGAAKRYNAE